MKDPSLNISKQFLQNKISSEVIQLVKYFVDDTFWNTFYNARRLVSV